MYLGIDLGTSAAKVCVIGDAGEVSATRSAALTMAHPFPGASEQDPRDWWHAVTDAVSALPEAMRSAVRAIGLSGQMHGSVLLDRNLQVLRPAILWNDGRAENECARIVEAESEAGVLSGAFPMPGFTAPKLLWLAQHEPECHARIAHVLLPKDYVGLMLHGGCFTDPSDAAGTGWLDQADRVWSDRLCEISATDPNWLPPIRPGADVAGRLRADVAEALGLVAGIPVAVGAGDAAAGAVGIGAVEDGDGFISLGTSGQLFVTTGSYRPNIESRLHAYAHTLPDRWFQMAAMLNGARPVAWLSRLTGRPLIDLLHEAETAAPGPLFLPYLSGERTPHGDAAIRAGFAWLDESTTQGSLMRAVVEAIAFTFVDAFEALARAGTRPGKVFAIGGGTRSDFVMQTIANATGHEILRAEGADIGPALGAARLAMASNTRSALIKCPKPARPRLFKPREETFKCLQERFAAYRALYPALRQIQRPR